MTKTFIDVLSNDHAKVQSILAVLEQDPNTITGIGPAQSTERGQRVDRLILDESQHEAVEEEWFWPAVRAHLADGDALADRAIAQETAAKKALEKLRKMKPSADDFEPLLSQVVRDAHAHIAFEEIQVWPRLREAMSAEEAEKLGTKLATAKRLAPTRPHPHTPPNPAVLKTVGAAAAVMDKARDAVSGREKP